MQNKIEDLIALLYDAATVVDIYEPKEETAKKWRIKWLKEAEEQINIFIRNKKK